MNRYGAFSTNDAAPDMPFGQQNRIQPAGQAFHSQYIPGRSSSIAPIAPVTGGHPATQPTPAGAINPQTFCCSCDTWNALLPAQKFGIVASVHPLPCDRASLATQLGTGISMAAVQQWSAYVWSIVAMTDLYCPGLSLNSANAR